MASSLTSLSSPGIGSGLDVNALVSKLMEVERQPLNSLTTKEADLQAKITSYGSIKSSLSTLQSAASALAATTAFTSVSAAVSDPSVLSATPGSSATVGSFDINVTQLAKNQVINSTGAYTDTDTFKAGLLAITVGGKTTNITITAGSNDTLAGISQSINAARAGVTASVINTGTNSRLVLTASSGGTAGSFTIAAAQQPGATGTQNLTDFVYNGTNTAKMSQTQAAVDAQFTLNNIPITRSSNTITDLISGVTLNLTKQSSATLTLGPNPSTAVSAVNSFVSAYNAAATLLRTSSAYDPSNQKASTLTGDSTVRSVESLMSRLLSSSVSGIAGGISSLADVGVIANKDGTLAVNTTRLLNALNDPNKDVAGLFTSTAVGNEGIAVRFNKAITDIVSSTGMIASRTSGINTVITGIGKQRTVLNQRMVGIEANYRAQFSALDTLIASMNTTSSYLAQQINSIQSMTNGINSGK